MRGRYRRRGFLSDIWKPILLYGGLAFLLAVARCSFFTALTFLPATPDLILGAVVAVALLDSRKAAIGFGIAGGFMADALGAVGISLSPLFYLLVALLVGLWTSKMMTGFLSWLALMIPALALRMLFSLGEILLFRGRYPLGEIWREILFPELICTLLFCLPLYFFVALCTLPIRRRKERSRR